jgi:hypothetical protein
MRLGLRISDGRRVRFQEPVHKLRWTCRFGITLLLGASIGGIASAVASQPSLYFYGAANTAACLYARPDSVNALPPATSPSRPILYVYFPPHDRYPYPPRARHLWVWYSSGREDTLQGARLIFFRGNLAARHYYERDAYSKGNLTRNVLIQWDHNRDTTRPLGKLVRGCLKTRAQGSSDAGPPLRALPKADITTFTGYWGGHTRSLTITASGRGLEYVDDGCCHFVIAVSFRLLRANGTVKNATATFRVAAVKRGEWSSKRRPRVGQIGQLVLRNGIVTDTLTGIYYCSDPAWGATGACGA